MKRRQFMCMLLLARAPRGDAQDRSVPPRFEVASIKASRPDAPGPTIRFEPGGRFVATGITAANLITLSYNIQAYQLHGAPAWLGKERFDIIAQPKEVVHQVTSNAARDAQMLRLRSLLAERFQLRVRRGQEQHTVLALIVDKAGAKAPPVNDRGDCPAATEGPGQITSMAMFAKTLSLVLGDFVIDRTGLSGNFCIRLKWTSDEGKPLGIGVTVPRQGQETDAQWDGGSLFGALQRQLGLRLQGQKGFIDVVTIDSVTRPSPN